MTRLRRYVKKIACVECDWFGRKDRTSVEPLLEALHALEGCSYHYRRCNTRSEFEYQLATVGRSPSYDLFYLAMHGTPGQVGTEAFSLSLEELGDLLGTKFGGRIVHFGACSTLRCEPSRIEQFIEQTGVAMVTGFTKDIDWLESAAFDLLYLGLWQKYKDVSAYERRLLSAYGEMAARLGFVAYKA